MEHEGVAPVTELLARYASGDAEAGEPLLRVLYPRLRQIAHRLLAKEARAATYQPTVLVHEAFLRLSQEGQFAVTSQNRDQFLGFAAQVMRHILVDHARKRLSQKRGKGIAPVELDPNRDFVSFPDDQLVALHEALEELGKHYPRPMRIVELKFFGGLGLEAIADQLQCSLATVKRDWTFAKAWLFRKLKST